MKKRLINFLILILLSFTLVSCFGGGNYRESNFEDPTLSLAYGYLDASKSRIWLKHLFTKQYKPVVEKFFYKCELIKDVYDEKISDGIFFVTLPPGFHQLFSYEGKTRRYFDPLDYIMYTMGNGKNETAIEIDKPGLYFMGSLNHINDPDRDGVYSIERTNNPSEKEILIKLKEYLIDDDEEEYARYIKMIDERLRSLG